MGVAERRLGLGVAEQRFDPHDGVHDGGETVLSKCDAKRASVRARERATETNTNRGYGAAFPWVLSKRAVCQEYAEGDT